MAERWRIVVAATVALAVTLAVAGCGVASSDPVDLGDGLAAGAQANTGNGPPGPDGFSAPDELVSAFLNAAVESWPRQPLDRVEQFLTEKAQKALQPKVTPNPPNPVIIRLLGDPVKAEFDQARRPVDVTYQVIGTLNNGRVDDLADSRVRTMRFWVSPSDNDVKTNRIDEIVNAPGPIMFTDQALYNYYQPQPIYFWDALSRELVPDLRYLPGGLGPDLRAGRIVQWLVDGPSGWLTGAAQRLPGGTAVKAVQIRPDGTIMVNLTEQAGLGGDAAIQRLYWQLQWSLQLTSVPAKIELDIEGKAVDPKVIGGLSEYLQYNLTSSLTSRGQKYDIVGGKVVSLPATSGQPAVLAVKENAAVTYAAMNRNASVAVLVRTTADGRRQLQIARDGAPTRTVSWLCTTKNAEVGRPAWINGDHLLLTCAGKLYAISANGGDAVDVTPSRPFSRVQSISVSPDGQRIAFVGDGQPYVASLSPSDNGTVTVGTTTRWLLGGQMSASAVAWINQSFLYVAGTSSAGTPVLYRVTADGVIAVNESKSLAAVKPSDVVAYPTGPFTDSPPEMYLLANQATYLFRSQQLFADPNKAPFFGY
jgi:hypothetical protein